MLGGGIGNLREDQRSRVRGCGTVAGCSVAEIVDVVIRPLGGRAVAALLKFERAPNPELVELFGGAPRAQFREYAVSGTRQRHIVGEGFCGCHRSRR